MYSSIFSCIIWQTASAHTEVLTETNIASSAKFVFFAFAKTYLFLKHGYDFEVIHVESRFDTKFSYLYMS